MLRDPLKFLVFSGRAILSASSSRIHTYIHTYFIWSRRLESLAAVAFFQYFPLVHNDPVLHSLIENPRIKNRR